MKTPSRFLLLFAVGVASAAVPAVIDKDSVRTFYRNFSRLTKEPIEVGQVPTISCVGLASPSEIRAQEKRTGPHTSSLVHYYANTEAEASYRAQRYPFPVGSVIIKEKITKDGTVVGIGGMRKREAGFDASHGDWEFFYTDAKTGFQIGGLRNCIECHSTARAYDHVFSVSRAQADSKKGKR